MSDLTHFDESGASRMVDVGHKPDSERTACASGQVRLAPATLQTIRDRKAAKGDVLEVARIAGIQAAKRTGDMIPLCHPLPITAVQIDFAFVDDATIRIEATVKTVGKTGVEMEALAAVAVGALTIYDMVKSIDRGIIIQNIQLEAKTGGTRGPWQRG